MLLLALVLLLALLFLGLGFTLHFLWIIAAIVFVFWLAGFAFRAGSGPRSLVLLVIRNAAWLTASAGKCRRARGREKQPTPGL